MKTKIGIYGNNGHQIQWNLKNNPRAELVAAAAFDAASMPDDYANKENIRQYETLEELIADPNVEIISLASPLRANQADDAIKCLLGGKHVYAEKPCALSEFDLDRIVNTSEKAGKIFHEMAGSAFDQPYLSMKKIVESGVLGTIIQVFSQKSYPYHERRPQDEKIDGGLLCQVSVHASRFVEHVAGMRIKDISAIETSLGNPEKDGGLRMAASMMMTLENGGIATIIANYLNPPAFKLWGNEHLRIFGSKGFIESVDGGIKTRLVLQDKDMGAIDVSEPSIDYFEMFLDELRGASMPFSLETELHPVRMLIRAKEALDNKNK